LQSLNLESLSLPPLPGPVQLRELAIAVKVCARPVLLRCTDTETGTATNVPMPCGATSESKCPSCADRARKLRMQQCREGWHREDEPERRTPETDGHNGDLDDQADHDDEQLEDEADDLPDRRLAGCVRPGAGRTCQTCRGCRWRTAPSGAPLPGRTGGPIGRRCS
jgi:hypothetical protein